MSCITKLVEHPKWSWSKGMLICPHFKLSQRIRVCYEASDYEGWLPVLEDRTTLSCMILLIIENGGSVSYNKGKYLINNKFESEHLDQIICEGLLDTWEDQSSSVSKNS